MWIFGCIVQRVGWWCGLVYVFDVVELCFVVQVVYSGGVGMVSLDVEKFQFGECVDKMLLEIVDLKNIIVSKDKQKEYFQCVFEDGVIFEKLMVDEI